MREILHNPKNYLEHITEMYAFVSVDEGGEGLVAMTVNLNGKETLMPFVASDLSRVHDLAPLAKDMALKYKKKIKLIRLSHREELDVFDGTKQG